MVKILRKTDRPPAVAKKHGVAEQTIYAWKKPFGSMTASDTKQLRSLEQENVRLNKLFAELDLELEKMTTRTAGAISQ